MVIETLEQMRARLDQCGVKCEDVDFVVAIVAKIDANPWLLPLSLVAMAEAADRLGLERTGLLALAANETFFDERSTV